MDHEHNLHRRHNEAVRFELLDRLDETGENAVRGFLRRAGLPHLFDELIRPTLLNGSALLSLAIQDRPWPPWGLGAQKVRALVFVCPVGDGAAGLSRVFTGPEDATNVGLMTALFKETLEQLRRRGIDRVHYYVAEGSVLAGRVLKSSGFQPGEAFTVTEHARYRMHQAAVGDVLRHLHLVGAYTPDLLAHRIEEATFDRNALFHATSVLASQSFWYEVQGVSEVIALFSLVLEASPPGGTPDGGGGGTRGPKVFEDLPPGGTPDGGGGGTRGPKVFEDLPPGGTPDGGGGGTRGPKVFEDLPPGGTPDGGGGGTRGPKVFEDLPPGYPSRE